VLEHTNAATGGYSPTGWSLIADTITTLATNQDAHGNVEVFAVNTTGSLFDQDAAHGRGGGPEEVAAIRPAVGVGRPHEPHVRLVDQGSRVEGVAGASWASRSAARLRNSS
jgi:hypothetical protein